MLLHTLVYLSKLIFPLRGEIDKKLEKLKTVERELTNKEQELQDVSVCVCECARERERVRGEGERETMKWSSQIVSCFLHSVLFSERDRFKPERRSWSRRPGEE